mmetsp:Transcript_9508/g.25633  ORF Transcript_9508/g.25633 Transcript_9508/m.25633 type:complete len:214 (+) Transcript_9508:708-1349(+)
MLVALAVTKLPLPATVRPLPSEPSRSHANSVADAPTTMLALLSLLPVSLHEMRVAALPLPYMRSPRPHFEPCMLHPCNAADAPQPTNTFDSPFPDTSHSHAAKLLPSRSTIQPLPAQPQLRQCRRTARARPTTCNPHLLPLTMLHRSASNTLSSDLDWLSDRTPTAPPMPSTLGLPPPSTVQSSMCTMLPPHTSTMNGCSPWPLMVTPFSQTP